MIKEKVKLIFIFLWFLQSLSKPSYINNEGKKSEESKIKLKNQSKRVKRNVIKIRINEMTIKEGLENSGDNFIYVDNLMYSVLENKLKDYSNINYFKDANNHNLSIKLKGSEIFDKKRNVYKTVYVVSQDFFDALKKEKEKKGKLFSIQNVKFVDDLGRSMFISNSEKNSEISKMSNNNQSKYNGRRPSNLFKSKKEKNKNGRIKLKQPCDIKLDSKNLNNKTNDSTINKTKNSLEKNFTTNFLNDQTEKLTTDTTIFSITETIPSNMIMDPDVTTDFTVKIENSVSNNNNLSNYEEKLNKFEIDQQELFSNLEEVTKPTSFLNKTLNESRTSQSYESNLTTPMTDSYDINIQNDENTSLKNDKNDLKSNRGNKTNVSKLISETETVYNRKNLNSHSNFSLYEKIEETNYDLHTSTTKPKNEYSETYLQIKNDEKLVLNRKNLTNNDLSLANNSDNNTKLNINQQGIFESKPNPEKKEIAQLNVSVLEDEYLSTTTEKILTTIDGVILTERTTLFIVDTTTNKVTEEKNITSIVKTDQPKENISLNKIIRNNETDIAYESMITTNKYDNDNIIKNRIIQNEKNLQFEVQPNFNAGSSSSGSLSGVVSAGGNLIGSAASEFASKGIKTGVEVAEKGVNVANGIKNLFSSNNDQSTNDNISFSNPKKNGKKRNRSDNKKIKQKTLPIGSIKNDEKVPKLNQVKHEHQSNTTESTKKTEKTKKPLKNTENRFRDKPNIKKNLNNANSTLEQTGIIKQKNSNNTSPNHIKKTDNSHIFDIISTPTNLHGKDKDVNKSRKNQIYDSNNKITSTKKHGKKHNSTKPQNGKNGTKDNDDYKNFFIPSDTNNSNYKTKVNLKNITNFDFNSNLDKITNNIPQLAGFSFVNIANILISIIVFIFSIGGLFFCCKKKKFCFK